MSLSEFESFGGLKNAFSTSQAVRVPAARRNRISCMRLAPEPEHPGIVGTFQSAEVHRREHADRRLFTNWSSSSVDNAVECGAKDHAPSPRSRSSDSDGLRTLSPHSAE